MAEDRADLRTNLGNFPDDLDPEPRDEDAAAEGVDTAAEDAATPEPSAPPPSAPAPPPADERVSRLEQEIAFLRAGQAAPQYAPPPAATPSQPDVLGMIDGVLGPYKPTPAEMADVLSDPSGQKLADFLYNAVRVATGAGAALGLQAAQAQATQQQSVQRTYEERGRAFNTKYPELGKYGTVVQTHAAQLHAELQGRPVAPQVFADEVARRANGELKSVYGIDTTAAPRRARTRPATAERGGAAAASTPGKSRSRRENQIAKFLGLH